MNLLLATVLCLGGLEASAATPDRAPLEVSFRSVPTVASHYLCLADVMEVRSDPQELWPLVRDVVVATGDRGHVGWADVRHRLRGAGLPSERLVISGPAFCLIARSPTRGGSR